MSSRSFGDWENPWRKDTDEKTAASSHRLLYCALFIISIAGILRPLGVVIHVLERYGSQVTGILRMGGIDRIRFRRAACRDDLGQQLQPDDIEPAHSALAGEFP